MPVGTQVGVVVLNNNKLPIAYESTARIHNTSVCGGAHALFGLTADQYARATARPAAEFDGDGPDGRPDPGRRRDGGNISYLRGPYLWGDQR